MLCAAYNFKQQCEEAHARLNEHLKAPVSKVDITDYDFQDSFLSSMILVEIETISDSDIEAVTLPKEVCVNSEHIESYRNHNTNETKILPHIKEKTYKNHNANEKEISPYVQEKVIKLYTCKLCKRSFRSRYGLSYHSKRHQGISHMCPFENCTKRFTNKQSLIKHKSIHSNERKHLCNICGKTFNLMDSLNYHLKTHDGGRLYLCAHCGRSFKQACHLKVHMWKHTGIKPYLCSSCGREYTTGNQLKRHRRKYCGIGRIPPKPKRQRDITDTSTENDLILLQKMI